MNTFIPLEKLEEFDLNDYHDVWLSTTETWPQDPATVHRKCLWRAKRELTQDVEIDDKFFENLPHLWLVVDDLNDQEAIAKVKEAVAKRADTLKLEGEFNPQYQHRDQAQSSSSSAPHEDANTDLRS